MKLFYIEDKYILIYRFVIVLVLTITISVSILGGIFGVAKWSGLLSGIDKVEKRSLRKVEVGHLAGHLALFRSFFSSGEIVF